MAKSVLAGETARIRQLSLVMNSISMDRICISMSGGWSPIATRVIPGRSISVRFKTENIMNWCHFGCNMLFHLLIYITYVALITRRLMSRNISLPMFTFDVLHFLHSFVISNLIWPYFQNQSLGINSIVIQFIHTLYKLDWNSYTTLYTDSWFIKCKLFQ